MNYSYSLIESAEALEQIVGELQTQSYIAIDLEADNQNLYEEQICLIQMSTQSNNYLIDTLKFKDLDSLKPIFLNQNIQKIFHDLEFDLRSLNKEFQIQFHHLSDTKMAAEFASEEKCSLSFLLEKYCQINAEKVFQKANWTQRPLPDDMLQYSIEDSYHLKDIADKLQTILEENGRYSWYQEECLFRENYVYVEPPFDEPFRIKGSGKLKGLQVNLLILLCEIRDQIAKKNNVSRFKVINNKNLIYHCSVFPKRFDLHLLGKNIQSQYKKAFLTEANLQLEKLDHQKPIPNPHQSKPYKDFVKSNIQQIKRWRMELSEKIKLPANYIWPTESIDLIANNPKVLSPESLSSLPSIRNWQMEEFGKDILQKLKPKLKDIK